jgi:hypothetical protein
LARLKVTTDADESMPLDQVPEDVRAQVVEKKVWRLRSLFETDLRKAFEYLDDLRTHQAWKYLSEPDMERLVENRCRISPAFVQQLRDGYASLVAVGHTGTVTADDVRRHQASTARMQAETVVPGKHRSPLSDNEEATQGTGSAYLLRRLARLGGDWLDRYEAGEFGSVRRAAIAAGIVKLPSVLDQLRKLWAKASDADRRTFMEEIGHGR